jgi:hypothetical protein
VMFLLALALVIGGEAFQRRRARVGS